MTCPASRSRVPHRRMTRLAGARVEVVRAHDLADFDLVRRVELRAPALLRRDVLGMLAPRAQCGERVEADDPDLVAIAAGVTSRRDESGEALDELEHLGVQRFVRRVITVGAQPSTDENDHHGRECAARVGCYRPPSHRNRNGKSGTFRDGIWNALVIETLTKELQM